MIAVEDKDLVDTRTIKSLRIEIIDLIFNVSARFRVMLFDSLQQLIKSMTVLIDGDDYKRWGNNDDVVLDIVLNKLELSLPKN